MTSKSLSTLTKLVREVLVESKLDKKQVSLVVSNLHARAESLQQLLSSTTSARKRKDPNAPRKNSSNYIHYCSDVRDGFRAKHPNLSNTELSTLIGKEWNRVKADPAVLKKYNDRALADKKRYAEAMSAYTPPSQESLDEQARTRTARRTKNGYNIFCEEQRALTKQKNPSLSSSQVQTELGKSWSALSEAEQLVYKNRASSENSSSLSSSSSQPVKATPAPTPAPTPLPTVAEKSAPKPRAKKPTPTPAESDEEEVVEEKPARKSGKVVRK
jgi:hypothetical protein